MTNFPVSSNQHILLSDYVVRSETARDNMVIEALYDAVFGPGRFTRAAERLREGNNQVDPACFVATRDDVAEATIRFWPLAIDGKVTDAVLLGPLAVNSHARGLGLAHKLIEQGVEACQSLGKSLVILVGDEPYYARSGFARAENNRFVFPAPVNPNRILCRELEPAGADLAGRLSVPRATTRTS